MDLGLEGKVAVVLASTRGLGRAVGEELLAEGASVAFSGVDAARVAGFARELEERLERRAWVERVDIADLGALERHLRGVRERFGTIHILVTNGGGPPTGPASELDVASLHRELDGTLGSAVHAIRTVLPWMRAQHWGRIVALTSLTVRAPLAGLALSTTLRAGLTGYLKSLASEVAADQVLVHSVCSGMFETDRLRELFQRRAERSGKGLADERALALRDIPLGRFGDPRELAALVAFLCSERAAFLTGNAFAIDGGASRSLL